ncbi:DENN domain containing protein [Lasiodiplodia theobromae]|uniref:DENN domain-containing protein n=1 Tax=Lasiodiplodia theobromae TaxID=45133 RepID=A0A5N5DM21_9PEZI|nr:DENN domain containing protein [Lasiodiplodia theobromae]KAB2578976.1 DENN domain-containing protein [Lasiodiplodia theobromae]KAF4546396.1 DENN domain containing protein [Lasiodiplodia theobromae]
MAPAPPSADPANLPLADYFFISGIESSQVYDAQRINGAAIAPAESTIEEDAALEVEEEAAPTPPRPTSSDGASLSKRASRETRQSISSVIGPDTGPGPTASNRSSATIKGFPQIGGSGLSDFDFDQALRKFAAERETFLEEIQFSAGTLKQEDRPRPRPKTQRIVSEDASTLGAGIGSIRRRISTIGRSQRNSSVMRNSSVRTSRRMSGYNSVIPAPRPFLHTPNMHPLKRRYEPVLLDRYPPKAMVDELKRRNPFPDYVPMFAFPNDVNVVSSDERPRSTWHGFAMTNGDGSKLHGICLTVWVPLNPVAAEELERQCEEWRKANMTPEERELAGSLGERLAAERAKLSRLLAQLPTVPSGSEEREQLEDDISAVEEKIGLMNDLLRPVRHGAASKIDGLTDGETGLWIPRAYGVLGREGGMTSFWKEWLRAVVVPMYQDSLLRIPASSPRIGMWQPLERYVVNLCAEALSPMSSITQVELAVRELRMYARKEAANELPGSRNTDIYALFRSLSIQNIVTLFEYVLSEGRIILLSSHTSMLHLASAAITHLLYPFKWAGVFIPVLPVRLIQALEAPCPYIVGIERRYENVELPEDDFVLVDLDQDVIESTAPPVPLPRQQRRKLISLLQLAAPHHIKYGVPTGPPAYAVDAFPYDSYSSENTAIFTHKAPRATLAHYFGPERMNTLRRPSQPILGHSSNLSTSTLGTEFRPPGSSYAPSVYAQSTLAASTVMPNAFSAPVRNSDTTQWCEGHCMQWRPNDERATCSICDEKAEDGMFRCTGCSVIAHPRCLNQICLVCPSAFLPDQVRAAFVRCFASLLYTYRRFLGAPSSDQKKSGLMYSFNIDGFMRSMPSENQEYFTMLRETQGFNEFIHERETTRSDDPSIKLFDQIILSKKNRGRTSFFSKSSTDFLNDTSDHLWRSAVATPPSARFPGDYRAVISRQPAKLDPTLMKEPRVIQGVPRVPQQKAKRKPIPSMIGGK